MIVALKLAASTSGLGCSTIPTPNTGLLRY
jgi:hypothetical protein